MLSKILKVYNQQEYLYKFYSSETRSKITFMFNTYFNNKPQQINKINSQFLEWFIGFTEGDGSFIISHNKVYFDIRQNIEDIQVLYYIKKNLGFGKIQVRAEIHRRVAVFFVTSKEHFYRLMLIFNGNLVSNYKSNQFKTWVNAFNNQYSENVYFIENKVEPSLSSAWLSGFIDAEGSFTGRVKKCNTSRLKKAPHLALTIAQKDKIIICKIRKLFFNNNKGLSYDKSWDDWRVQISSFSKLDLVINYLNKFPLRTKKNIAFIRFKHIHNLIMNKRHLCLEGLNTIESIIKKVNKQD